MGWRNKTKSNLSRDRNQKRSIMASNSQKQHAIVAQLVERTHGKGVTLQAESKSGLTSTITQFKNFHKPSPIKKEVVEKTK